jgi:hypothetical protein
MPMPLLPDDAGKYREGQITSDLAGGATYWVVRLSTGLWWLGDRFSEGPPAEADVARFGSETEAQEVLHLVGSPLGGGYVVRFRDTPGRVVVDILRPISAP